MIVLAVHTLTRDTHRRLVDVYRRLESAFEYQGWWPLVSRANESGYDADGYRVSAAVGKSLERNDQFEIAAGAILTQNTAWENARRALASLRKNGLIDPTALRRTGLDDLAQIIRSSGYFNQKARKLRMLAEFFDAEVKAHGPKGGPSAHPPERERLLKIWGIGPETADSILLYAFGAPVFVVDGYTKRTFERIGLVAGGTGYAAIQEMFHASLAADVELFGEFHALIVRHGKRYCRVKPACRRCPLLDICTYGRDSLPLSA